jgi:hypothetical protein
MLRPEDVLAFLEACARLADSATGAWSENGDAIAARARLEGYESGLEEVVSWFEGEVPEC